MKTLGKLCTVLIICVVLLCGCSSEASVEEKLVGNWIPETLDEITLEIYEDGTCLLSGEYHCSWKVTDAGLEITNPDEDGETVIFEIREVTDTSVTMTIGEDVITCYRADVKKEF